MLYICMALVITIYDTVSNKYLYWRALYVLYMMITYIIYYTRRVKLFIVYVLCVQL